MAESGEVCLEVTVVRAILPAAKAVLARVFVDGEVFGTTSKRRPSRDSSSFSISMMSWTRSVRTPGHTMSML